MLKAVSIQIKLQLLLVHFFLLTLVKLLSSGPQCPLIRNAMSTASLLIVFLFSQDRHRFPGLSLDYSVPVSHVPFHIIQYVLSGNVILRKNLSVLS